MRFVLQAIANHARLFEVLGTLSEFRVTPAHRRLQLLLRAITPTARGGDPSYPLTGPRAVKLNAAISRFYFRQWLRISISESDSAVLGRYSSACEAVVEFLKYAGVGNEDFSENFEGLIKPFLEWSRRRHSLMLGLTDDAGPIHAVIRRCQNWRGLCSTLWRAALWAAISVYRIRLERLDHSVRRHTRELAVDKSLDIKRRKVTLLAASSDTSLRAILAVQLSVSALKTLVQIREADHQQSRLVAGVLARAVAALDSNLERALTLNQENGDNYDAYSNFERDHDLERGHYTGN